MDKRMILCSSLSSVASLIGNKLKEWIDAGPIVVIDTAARVYDGFPTDWYLRHLEALRSLGYPLIEFDVTGKSQEEISAILEPARAVCMMGGNSFYLRDQMALSGFVKASTDFFNRGGVYIGTSAGAVVATPDIAYIQYMDDPSKSITQETLGLSLVKFYIIPHIHRPRYEDKVQKVLADLKKNEKGPFLGLRDDQVLFIDGTYMEVVS